MLLALTSLLVACGEPQAADTQDGQPRFVRVAHVVQEEHSRELRFSGITRSARRATLAFQVSGTLAERPVEVGQTVSKGQLLARLYNPALAPGVAAGEARVAELDARLEQLARDVQRADEVYARQLISIAEVEKVRSQQQVARASRDLAAAQLTEARQQLQQASLLAPFAASVDAVLFEPGEFVAAGQAAILISGTGALEVEFAIPESLIDEFVVGRQVSLNLPFLQDRQVSAHISQVGEAGGRAGGLFPVEVVLESDEQGLRPGLTVELLLPVSASASLSVPLAAILDPGTGQPRVFRVRGDRVEPVFVKVGRLQGSQVEVFGPLQEGEQVVITSLGSLTPGQQVEILQ
ncbi:MAG: efflux RND transporter periplasmic adaptor subunit [Gammaproteobacteria bacterium]|nr:efflux RND transporter periplasmic adaptor subunit [Gammaproteobacteria bacterium]